MSDTIIIEESRRAGARLVIGLAGPSGEGKTYTALLLAYGLANCDARKVGLLDAENKRGSLYSDILPGGARFRRGDLYAPFSPERYIDGIEAFQAAGVEVLVIDSVTHEWEGPGGCEEIAEKNAGKVANWKLAKKLHKQFVNKLLLCDMHVICCIRAREKTSFKNPAKPESLGIQPICEKNFMFEMTASLMMEEKGKRQKGLKVPAELLPILGRGTGYIGIEDGKALRAWVDGAGADPLEPLRNRLRLAASDGTGKLQEAWRSIKKSERVSLGEPFLRSLQAQAIAVDQAAATGGEDDAPEAPKTREEMIAIVRANCAPGNSYGVNEAQFLAYFAATGIDEVTDSELTKSVNQWPEIVGDIAKEEAR